MDDDLENVYVIDTCVLINDPDVLYKLRRCTIVIPTAAVKELDSLKTELQLTGSSCSEEGIKEPR